MSLASPYELYGLSFDPEADPVVHNGKSYSKLLNEDFSVQDFSEPALCRYLGKGVHADSVLLLIPSISKKVIDNYDDSLKYMIKKMDKYVASKFSLIVCQTCVYWTDSQSYYFVNFWYSMLPRNFKRNLYKVYLVHPYTAARTLVNYSFGYSNVECVDTIGPLLTKLGLAKAGMLKQFPYVVQRMEEILLGISTPISPFTELPVLAMRTGHSYKMFPSIPPILSKLLDTIEQHVDIHHLLYLQCPVDSLYNVVNEVERIGEFYEYETPAEAVAMLNLILNSQVGGLLGPKAYITVKNAVTQSIGADDILNSVQSLTSKLPSIQKDYIWCIIKTLRAVARKSGKNGHSVKKISRIYASTFFRPLSCDRDVAKVIPACEHILANMIEKPETFFKKESYTRLVSTQVKSSSKTSADKHSAQAKSSGSAEKLSSAASTPVRQVTAKDALVHTSSASSQDGQNGSGWEKNAPTVGRMDVPLDDHHSEHHFGHTDSIEAAKRTKDHHRMDEVDHKRDSHKGKERSSKDKRRSSDSKNDGMDGVETSDHYGHHGRAGNGETRKHSEKKSSKSSALPDAASRRAIVEDESPIVKEPRAVYKSSIEDTEEPPTTKLSKQFAEELKIKKAPSFRGKEEHTRLAKELREERISESSRSVTTESFSDC